MLSFQWEIEYGHLLTIVEYRIVVLKRQIAENIGSDISAYSELCAWENIRAILKNKEYREHQYFIAKRFIKAEYIKAKERGEIL